MQIGCYAMSAIGRTQRDQENLVLRPFEPKEQRLAYLKISKNKEFMIFVPSGLLMRNG